MIAFAASVSEAEPYWRYAEPGIRLAAEPDSETLRFSAVGTIGRSYNLFLDHLAAREDLEALVLVHPHMEIADPQFCAKVRTAFADPEVAVLGCAGGRGLRGIAWWDAEHVSAARGIHRYLEHGGGDAPAYGWASPEPAPAEVDAVDGFLLVLSPWAVRHLRFDEALWFGHGFDIDFCLQARTAGRKVMTADLYAIQHRALSIIEDLELWTEAHIDLAQKWPSHLGGGSADDDEAAWRQRARRAEAERESARAVAYSRRLESDARIEQLEKELRARTETASWKLTEPLRVVNQWRAQRANASADDRPRRYTGWKTGR